MNGKNTLVATFVKKDEVLSFIEKTRKSLNIGIDKIYVYTIGDNDGEYLATVSISHDIKPFQVFDKPIVVHTKNGSIFSINALNTLIDEKMREDGVSGLKDNKDYEINWDEYKSKLIMLNKGALRITDIEKIEDKAQFLK